MYLLIIIAISIASMVVSSQLKRKFKKYSQVQLQNGLSGREIAEKMLADHGIRGVQVISTQGQLTDHYNPKTKTVNLSEAVYSQRNAAAAAVAAHECGHAVQHAQGYEWLQMRSTLVTICLRCNHAKARLLASYSTGRVIKLNKVPRPNKNTPATAIICP